MQTFLSEVNGGVDLDVRVSRADAFKSRMEEKNKRLKQGAVRLQAERRESTTSNPDVHLHAHAAQSRSNSRSGRQPPPSGSGGGVAARPRSPTAARKHNVEAQAHAGSGIFEPREEAHVRTSKSEVTAGSAAAAAALQLGRNSSSPTKSSSSTAASSMAMKLHNVVDRLKEQPRNLRDRLAAGMDRVVHRGSANNPPGRLAGRRRASGTAVGIETSFGVMLPGDLIRTDAKRVIGGGGGQGGQGGHGGGSRMGPRRAASVSDDEDASPAGVSESRKDRRSPLYSGAKMRHSETISTPSSAEKAEKAGAARIDHATSAQERHSDNRGTNAGSVVPPPPPPRSGSKGGSGGGGSTSSPTKEDAERRRRRRADIAKLQLPPKTQKRLGRTKGESSRALNGRSTGFGDEAGRAESKGKSGDSGGVSSGESQQASGRTGESKSGRGARGKGTETDSDAGPKLGRSYLTQMQERLLHEREYIEFKCQELRGVVEETRELLHESEERVLQQGREVDDVVRQSQKDHEAAWKRHIHDEASHERRRRQTLERVIKDNVDGARHHMKQKLREMMSQVRDQQEKGSSRDVGVCARAWTQYIRPATTRCVSWFVEGLLMLIFLVVQLLAMLSFLGKCIVYVGRCIGQCQRLPFDVRNASNKRGIAFYNRQLQTFNTQFHGALQAEGDEGVNGGGAGGAAEGYPATSTGGTGVGMGGDHGGHGGHGEHGGNGGSLSEPLHNRRNRGGSSPSQDLAALDNDMKLLDSLDSLDPAIFAATKDDLQRIRMRGVGGREQGRP